MHQEHIPGFHAVNLMRHPAPLPATGLHALHYSIIMKLNSSFAKTFPAPSAEAIRIAKYLASAGLGSRRGCEEFILAGRVKVNGNAIATPALNVIPGQDEIRFDDKPVKPAGLVYLLLNKPVGYTCSAKDEHAAHLLSELIPERFGRLFTVGRLDRDSEGAIICTNDGNLAQRLAHPRYEFTKYYRVWVRGRVLPETLQQLEKGISDEGELLHADRAMIHQRLSEVTVLELILKGGKKREIRRLCRCFNLPVLRLMRTTCGPVQLGRLKPGEWRHLHAAERLQLLSP